MPLLSGLRWWIASPYLSSVLKSRGLVCEVGEPCEWVLVLPYLYQCAAPGLHLAVFHFDHTTWLYSTLSLGFGSLYPLN